MLYNQLQTTMSDRLKALELLEQLTNDDNGYTHEEILEYVIKNFLSGHTALECMEAAILEFPVFEEEEGEEDEEESDECPECMSTDHSDWDFDYDTGRKQYKCDDCGTEFFK